MSEISEFDKEMLEICREEDRIAGRMWAYLYERRLVGLGDFVSFEKAWRENMRKRGIVFNEG